MGFSESLGYRTGIAAHATVFAFLNLCAKHTVHQVPQSRSSGAALTVSMSQDLSVAKLRPRMREHEGLRGENLCAMYKARITQI